MVSNQEIQVKRKGGRCAKKLHIFLDYTVQISM